MAYRSCCVPGEGRELGIGWTVCLSVGSTIMGLRV